MQNFYQRISFFPISFFSVILGLAGFTVVIQRAEKFLSFPLDMSPFLLGFTVASLSLMTILYGMKIIFFPDKVSQEINHPIKLNFFPTFSISFLLLSGAFLSIDQEISKYLWGMGTGIHILFTLRILSIWIQDTKFHIQHMNPSWFIPAVGNILIPVTGIEHAPLDVSWFFFSIGLFFWVSLFIIFFNRIIFHNPLPEKLLPTLFILIAPPAVGFISFVKMTGEIGDFARIMYYISLFLVILVLTQSNMFRRIRFYLSWWAYSFPMASISLASILFFHKTESPFFFYLSWGFVILLSGLIILLIVRTFMAISRQEICLEEE